MCEIPVDLGGALIDLAYGQLRPNGASYKLIQAVRNADEQAIRNELLKIEDEKTRESLIEIIQQIGVILGRQR